MVSGAVSKATVLRIPVSVLCDQHTASVPLLASFVGGIRAHLRLLDVVLIQDLSLRLCDFDAWPIAISV